MLLLSGCATGGLNISSAAAKQTFAKGTLRNDVLRGLAITESAWGQGCSSPTVTRIETVAAPSRDDLRKGELKEGRFREHWYIDRCGKEVIYEIEYIPDGRSGTYFGMKMINQGA
jgi:hypothetical protein